MLVRVDRVQMAVPDRAGAAEGWARLLDAEPDREDRLAGLAARRSRYRLGDGFVELLEPDGAGPVADAVARRGAHLFAAGVTTADVDGLHARLRERGADALAEGGQLFVDASATGGHGLRLVVSADDPQPPVGLVDGFYEVTQLVDDVTKAVDVLVDVTGLDPAAFVPIESEQYGYAGTLTLFRAGHLHRIEAIHPYRAEKTMGRFHGRFGESLYMAFAETDRLAEIEQRARESGVGHTPVPGRQAREGRGPDSMFLHPPALGGMMLGLSRRTWAWRWSGSPERIEPQD